MMSEAPINVLSPAEIERQKTKHQQAEDIAYTINHSFYCTLTDFLKQQSYNDNEVNERADRVYQHIYSTYSGYGMFPAEGCRI